MLLRRTHLFLWSVICTDKDGGIGPDVRLRVTPTRKVLGSNPNVGTRPALLTELFSDTDASIRNSFHTVGMGNDGIGTEHLYSLMT